MATSFFGPNKRCKEATEDDYYLSKTEFRYTSGELKRGRAFPESTSATHTVSLLLVLSSYSQGTKLSIGNIKKTKSKHVMRMFNLRSLYYLIKSNGE